MEHLIIYTLLAWIHLFPDFLRLNPIHYFVESRDFCLHESFNATCRPGSVVLQMTGTYGRMKLGRCINGNYNIGCSKDVIKYLDSRCSGRETCDVNIRNLVDVHPCQRDFMSYLEASYKCIEVAGYGLSVCPREAHLTLTDPKGYMSNMQSPAIGSETCPWRIIARPGQSIELKIIVINSESTLPTTSDDMIVCSAVIVVNDEFVGVKEFNICAAGKNRERQLFTSSGHELTVHWTPGSQQETSPRFIMSYDATGCPDLEVPQNAWMKRTGDNVIIKCNNSMETWYFTCQRSQWIGELGNCSDRISRLKKESSAKEHLTLPAHGIALAVTIGVLLGVFVGVILLLVANCARRRTKRNLRKRQKFSSSNQKDVGLVDDQGSFYRSSKARHQGDSYPTLLTGKDKVYNVEKVYDFSGSNLGGLQDNDSKCSFYPLSVTPEMSMRNESIDIYNTGSDVDAHKVRTPSQHRCYAHRMQPISGSRPGNEFAGNDVVGRGTSLDQFGSPAGVAYRKTIWPTEAGRSVSEEISLHPAGLYCSRKEAPLLSLRSETRQTIQLKSSNDHLVAS